jgi:hypothetical protein
MHTLGLNFSIHNPILMYSFLAVYCLMDLLMLAFVHSKCRRAARGFKTLWPICAIRSLTWRRSALGQPESSERAA